MSFSFAVREEERRMKESIYKSYEELPLFLNAETVAKVLGVAPSTAYARSGFPYPEDRQPDCCPERAVHRLGAAYRGRDSVKHQKWPKRDSIKNYFPVPNEVFLLGLSPGELAVYSYLGCVRLSQSRWGNNTKPHSNTGLG